MSELLGIAGSLLGGLFGKKQKAPSAYQQTMEGIKGQAEGARKYGEEFGFNPLTLLGVSSPMGAGVAPENYMGQAIADAALLAADGLAKNAAAQKLERAEMLNSKLQQQVTDLTIRPKVGGIYDQRVATPTVRQALGVSDGPLRSSSGPVVASGAAVDGAASDDLSEPHWADPRREVEGKNIETHPGVMVIDNPHFGRMFAPTLDGDEALQWYEYPSLVVPWATRERGIGFKSAKWLAENLKRPDYAKSGIGYKKPKPPYKGDYRKELSDSWRATVGNPSPFPLSYPQYVTNWGKRW